MRNTGLLIFIFALAGLSSCKKDDTWISMTAMENAVWIEINAFRSQNGKSAVTANYDTMVEQAKYYSSFLASGNTDQDGSELLSVWDIIHDRWGGTNEVAIVTLTQKGSSQIYAEDIIEPVINQQDTADELLGDVTIGGVGIAYDPGGNAYTTILMMKVE